MHLGLSPSSNKVPELKFHDTHVVSSTYLERHSSARNGAEAIANDWPFRGER